MLPFVSKICNFDFLLNRISPLKTSFLTVCRVTKTRLNPRCKPFFLDLETLVL